MGFIASKKKRRELEIFPLEYGGNSGTWKNKILGFLEILKDDYYEKILSSSWL